MRANDFYMVKDSFAKHYFKTPPTHIIVTDWTLLEQLLALGVTPIGAPEVAAYKRYAPEHLLPKLDGITDIGQRRSPNIGKIIAMQPELVILGTDQKGFEHILTRKLRVMYYQNFSDRFDNNGNKIFKRLHQLGTLVSGSTQTATTLISDYQKRLTEQKDTLAQHYSNVEQELPRVALIRFLNAKKLIGYAEHSITGFAAASLGLTNAITLEKNKFGEQTFTARESAEINADVYLCFAQCQHATEFGTLDSSRVIDVGDVWPYGGLPALETITQGLTQALISDKN